MTSNNTFPTRFTKVDLLTLPDHYYLEPEDRCYFFGDYSAGRGATYSPTNQMVYNFKKSLARKGMADWKYKARAVSDLANTLRNAIKLSTLTQSTFVPIPPSKAKTDPAYDDRLLQLLSQLDSAIRPHRMDIRELVVQAQSYDPSHGADARMSPDDLAAIYRVDNAVLRPTPTKIIVVDDVLTTGSHFKAMQATLSRQFPDVPIVGLFIARRVPANPFTED